MKIYILGILLPLLFISCSKKSENYNLSTTSVAQLGLLANATVKTYVVESDGSRILLYTERTSDGTTFDEVGKFNNHFSELEDNKFYIYEVTGGDDRDANDDGILDNSSTKNNGRLRLVSKGIWLKEITDIVRITVVSEIQYLQVRSTLLNDYANIETKLEKSVKGIVSHDINSDGSIDSKDISAYDPVNSKEKLHKRYKDSMSSIISKIHFNDKSFIEDVFNPYIGNYNTYGLANGVTLSSDGTKAYTTDLGFGLQIIDISTPESPTLLGSIDTAGLAKAVTLSSDNTKAYVAYGNAGLKIIDISTPSSPTLLGIFDTDGYAYGVTLSTDGKKAYIADGSSGLKIIDISTPSSPTRLGTYHTESNVQEVVLSSDGTKACYVDIESGLKIIDISTPSSPTLIGTIETSGSAYGITLSTDDKKAYIADGKAGLKIIDISIPSTPTLLGKYDTENAQGVTLSSDGTKAYVADGNSGLQTIHVSTSEFPTLLGTIKTSDSAYRVTLSVDGTKAYVADSTSGLKIMDISQYNN